MRLLSSVLERKLWEAPGSAFDPEIASALEESVARARRGLRDARDLQLRTQECDAWINFELHPVLNEEGVVTQLLVAVDRHGSWKRCSSSSEICEKWLRSTSQIGTLKASE